MGFLKYCKIKDYNNYLFLIYFYLREFRVILQNYCAIAH